MDQEPAKGRLSPAAHPLGAYQRRRRLVFAIVGVAILVALIFIGSSHSVVVADRIRYFGATAITIGFCGRLWASLYIGGVKSVSLVTSGPYSMTRNPLYFFSSIAAGGIGAQTGSLVAAVFCFVVCGMAFVVVAKREEKILELIFGTALRAYFNRVPRFMPKPWLYTETGLVTFDPTAIRRTFCDGLVFFLAIPLFEIVSRLQETDSIVPALLLP